MKGGLLMYRFRKFIHFIIFAFIVEVVCFNTKYNPFIQNEAVEWSQSVEDVAKTEDALYKEIEQKESEYIERPQEGINEKRREKTPGRNGRNVDVAKSYEQMKKKGTFDESLLVFEQTPPEVTFKDLSASPVYRGHPEKEMVALLINVSWGTEHIPDILNTLKEHNSKATFFIEGKWAKENADLVKMIDEQGHTIGNHAYNHPNMARLSSQQITEQITKTNTNIEAIIDKTPKWFAPPSGSFTDKVVDNADHLNMETILWTVDTIDWRSEEHTSELQSRGHL